MLLLHIILLHEILGTTLLPMAPRRAGPPIEAEHHLQVLQARGISRVPLCRHLLALRLQYRFQLTVVQCTTPLHNHEVALLAASLLVGALRVDSEVGMEVVVEDTRVVIFKTPTTLLPFDVPRKCTITPPRVPHFRRQLLVALQMHHLALELA
jgi:hypothetical protein